MYYQHNYFSLNDINRKVFDRNGKELRLTGNAYRVLVFLCENKAGTITALGDFLDRARDYNENHMRQYKYKINTIIGYDVVEYKNNIYSLCGELAKTNMEPEINNSITNLLQEETVKLRENNDMNQRAKVLFYKFPAIIAAGMLILSLFSWPYGYYALLRIVITAVAAYYVYYLHASLYRRNFWFWCLLSMTILFNPIVPIYLSRLFWVPIDIVSSLFFTLFIIKFKKYKL